MCRSARFIASSMFVSFFSGLNHLFFCTIVLSRSNISPWLSPRVFFFFRYSTLKEQNKTKSSVHLFWPLCSNGFGRLCDRYAMFSSLRPPISSRCPLSCNLTSAPLFCDFSCPFVVRSYRVQDRFGEELGEEVWEGCNAVFDRLPLATVIDHDIFCVHGGIPRPLPESTSRVQVIFRLACMRRRSDYDYFFVVGSPLVFCSSHS